MRNTSFLSMLAVLFIGLKLADVITWSWVWVLAPIWALPAVMLASFVVVFVSAFIGALRRR